MTLQTVSCGAALNFLVTQTSKLADDYCRCSSQPDENDEDFCHISFIFYESGGAFAERIDLCKYNIHD